MATLQKILAGKARPRSASFTPTFIRSRLQHKCACGGTPSPGAGECEECRQKRLLRQRDTIASSGTKPNEATYSYSKQRGALAPIPRPSASPRFSPDFCKIVLLAPGLPTLVQAKSSVTSPPLFGAMQPKFAIGRIDDPLEYEADRIADQVLRMPAPELPGAVCLPQIDRNGTTTLSHDEKSQTLRTKPVGSAKTTVGQAPDIVHEVLRTPGQALDSTTRGFFEPRFGHDFSEVRVHVGPDADQSARSVAL
jgi:hypothetical protein